METTNIFKTAIACSSAWWIGVIFGDAGKDWLVRLHDDQVVMNNYFTMGLALHALWVKWQNNLLNQLVAWAVKQIGLQPLSPTASAAVVMLAERLLAWITDTLGKAGGGSHGGV